MTDITFVTSNQTKLAHARYLCRDFHVNILYYKKLYYGVGYEEPRIYDRDQLLTASFYDAASRWKKNVSGSEDRLFFIEDTSVKIDALSDSGNEVPGVDVKYWMRTMNFEKLDSDLKSRGNNRRCSVTSHLILFLTENLKKRLGVTVDYKVFKSTAYGRVTEKEYDFETNILYPWLDNKTFNKWFVPDGCDLPVSMLDITEADAGDFRKKAFSQMLTFLKDNGAIEYRHQTTNQLSLQFYDSLIICGRTCSGKSTLGKALVDDYGYYHIEASVFMTHKRLETHGSRSKVDKHLFAAKMLEAEPVFVVDRLIEYMHEKKIFDRFVITGFRTKEEIEAFLEKYHAERLHLVFVDSNIDERFKRWKLRQREVDNYTIERFKEIDALQEGMGIGEIENMQGMVTVPNNTEGVMTVCKQLRNMVLHGQKREILSINRKKLSNSKLSLERAILITLALEFQKDSSKSYTTTEISHLVNKYFRLVRRNKNNVSRYFNQSFYLYYEVKFENQRNRYKISPIGYSEALLTLRHLDLFIEKKSEAKEAVAPYVESLSIAFEKRN